MVCRCEIFCIMWQLHFSRFLESVFWITLEMRCLLVRSNYLRKLGTITLRGGSSFLGYIFVVRLHNIIATTLQLRFVFVCHCDIVLLRHNYVISLFKGERFDGVRITLNSGNCWNVWILYGTYVRRWSFFSWSLFF